MSENANIFQLAGDFTPNPRVRTTYSRTDLIPSSNLAQPNEPFSQPRGFIDVQFAFGETPRALITGSAKSCGGFFATCGSRSATIEIPFTCGTCTPITQISGPGIKCSNPSEVTTYTIVGADEAGIFLWDLPDGWTSSAAPLPNTPLFGGNFDYITNTRSIVVQPDGSGNPGNINVLATEFLCDGSRTETFTRAVLPFNDQPAPSINLPTCAKINRIPNYFVTNPTEANTNYLWEFSHSSLPSFTAESTGDERIRFFHPAYENQTYTIKVTPLANSCHNGISTTSDKIDNWFDQVVPGECQNIVFSTTQGTQEYSSEYLSTDNTETNETIVSSPELDQEMNVSLFPNPANNLVNVSFNQANFSGTLTIYSMVGKLLISQPISAQSTTVDISTLSQGQYIVKVIGSDQQTITRSLVKR